jgi:hypothetical protein
MGCASLHPSYMLRQAVLTVIGHSVSVEMWRLDIREAMGCAPLHPSYTLFICPDNPQVDGRGPTLRTMEGAARNPSLS